MRLSIGTHLGPYEILSPIGEGGMGEVYKARDNRLNRTVAIKVLPADVSAHPGAKQRFRREAETIAALNHPHICILHDVGEENGADYLVMELLDGETLAQRLTRGALPLNQAVKYASEIADALDKAHRQGIVHRDLKPGNIMLTKSGAKLLDFGLAKLKQPAVPPTSVSTLPTKDDITAQGVIIGTLQYMAPEQLNGEEPDARTDIFAFGAVLYEMVTGKRAFEGKTQAALISAIMSSEPASLAELRSDLVPDLGRIVRRCLAKDPENRWQSSRDMTIELSALSEPSQSSSVASRKSALNVTIVAVTIALAIGLTAGFLISREGRRAMLEWSSSTIRFSVFPEGRLETGVSLPFVLSPDGRHIAFATTADGKKALWLRSWDALTAQMIPKTDGAEMPFWSPDSQWIGFYAAGRLKKVSLQGGEPQTIASVGGAEFDGADWSTEQTILFVQTFESPLFRVPASGGTPVQQTHFDSNVGDIGHSSPRFLADGRRFLYTATGRLNRQYEIHSGTIGSTEQKMIATLPPGSSSNFAYVPGYLIYVNSDGILTGQAFDEKNLKVVGDPIPLFEGIPLHGPNRAPFSVSANGVMAFRSGIPANQQLTWFQRDGIPAGTVFGLGVYNGIALSGDGTRLAYGRGELSGKRNIWMLDLPSGKETRLTSDGDSFRPKWSSDGRQLTFTSARETRPPNIFTRDVVRLTDEKRLMTATSLCTPTDWNGDDILYVSERDAGSDLFVLQAGSDRPHRELLHDGFNKSDARISRDGHWMAYVSDESGRKEVWVISYPGMERRRQLSTNGGRSPRWRRDGKELFYISNDGGLMAIPIINANTFETGPAKKLFVLSATEFDVMPDGQKFLAVVETDTTNAPPISIVVNWPATIKK